MKEKQYNIELIRMISFVFVVCVHVSNYYCRAIGKIPGKEYAFSMTVDVFTRICVPCFFMISGILLLGRKEPVIKSLQRTWRYFSVLLFWTVVYSVFNRYILGRKNVVKISELLQMPAEAHLWYIYALISISLTIPFMQIIVNKMKREHEIAILIIGAAAGLCLFFFEGSYLKIPWFGAKGHCVYYFYLGYYLNKYKDRIPLKNVHLILIYFGVSLINAGIGIWKSVETDMFWKSAVNYRNPLILIASAAFMLFMLRLGEGNIQPSDTVKKWIHTVCECSFGIYLSHILFLHLFTRFVPAKTVPAYIGIPGIVVGTTAVSFVFIYLIRKIPGGKSIC